MILCRVKTAPDRQARVPKQERGKANAVSPKASERERDAIEPEESRVPAKAAAARAVVVLK